MPELPEVERVRLTLKPIVGRRITRIQIHRADVIHPFESTRRPNRASLSRSLLTGAMIATLKRHGKQLAICAAPPSIDDQDKTTRHIGTSTPNSKSPQIASACFCVHLGMTGALTHQPASTAGPNRSKAQSTDWPKLAPHTHVVWHLDDGSRLLFRDPRRFGGIWPFPSLADLMRTRWGKLGPDATLIKPTDLQKRLTSTGRGLKSVLLDQGVIAGLGNIYVDELLFKTSQHPLKPANTLDRAQVKDLALKMKRLLTNAIKAGGSTLRDYIDGQGKKGGFQNQHQVYGRGGKPCCNCKTDLEKLIVSGRSTVFCPRCQYW